MALQSSGSISMGDMRTEFGISGAISMSDLYRGGSEVPSSVNTTVTVSEVANILTGYGYAGARYNHGNTATSTSPNTGADYGYWRGGVAHASGPSYVDYYTNYTFFYNSSYNSTSAIPPDTVFDLTFSHTATYYYQTFSYELTNGTFHVGTSSDDDSLVDDVLGSSGSGASPVTRNGSFSATAGSPVRVSVKMPYVNIGSPRYSNIYNQVAINTGSSGSGSRALSVNSGVPSSGTISFSDLYSSIGS
tara:strand:- start:511 stop:1251 length:741 start_codon:yes stop_codon:yes gene_type:complete